MASLSSAFVALALACFFCIGYVYSEETLDGGKVGFCCVRQNGLCAGYCSITINNFRVQEVANEKSSLDMKKSIDENNGKLGGKFRISGPVNLQLKRTNLEALLNDKDVAIVEQGKVGFCCHRQYGRCTRYCNMNVNPVEGASRDDVAIVEQGKVGFCCHRQYGRCTRYCNMSVNPVDGADQAPEIAAEGESNTIVIN